MHRIRRFFPLGTVLFGVGLLLACAQEMTAPMVPERAVASAKASEFPECPQTQSSTKAWIGPAGGSLKAGSHVLNVPAGALSTVTLITMQAPTDTISRVRFGPGGLRFNKKYPATLVTQYDECTVRPTSEQQIVQVNESLQVIDTPPSQDDPLAQQVVAKLYHFSDYVLMSTYAVAY